MQNFFAILPSLLFALFAVAMVWGCSKRSEQEARALAVVNKQS